MKREHCQVTQMPRHQIPPASPPSNVQTLASAEYGKKKDARLGMKKQEFQTFATSKLACVLATM
jgi:peptide subunit release factor 1 (eRF1)